jgi:phage protein D
MNSGSSSGRVGSGDELYFGPSEAADAPPPLRNVTFELKHGLTLLSFKPTLTTANQVKSVTVRGWNRRTRRRIRETASVDDSAIRINSDLLHLLDECDQRDEIVVNEPVFTPGQARTRATALLRERLKQMVEASGTCIGLPDLRAGQQVQIEGIGSRFSGAYFVTSTTHTINDKGYLTKFTARREDTG